MRVSIKTKDQTITLAEENNEITLTYQQLAHLNARVAAKERQKVQRQLKEAQDGD